MPRNPLCSGNGNADEHAELQAELRGTLVLYYTYAGFLTMGNGDGDRFSCLVRETSSWYYCCGVSGFGNGEWRRISRTCFQQPVPRAMSIDQ